MGNSNFEIRVFNGGFTGDVDVTMRRTKGLILVNQQKIAQIENPSDEAPPNVSWRLSILAMHKLDKDALLAALRQQVAQPISAEEWCS